MKIRNGFVSNSSSSSFCIYGSSFDMDEFSKLAEKLGLKADAVDDDDEFDFDEYDAVERACAKFNLEVHMPSESDTFYVGRSLTDIKDNETGKEFKDSVKKNLKELFGRKIDCEYCEESWYG